MADNVVTRLIVEGGREFIDTMAKSAIAQQRLIDTVASAANLPDHNLARGIVRTEQALIKAGGAATTYVDALKLAGKEVTPEFEKVLDIISKNSKALKEYANDIEQVNRRQKELAQQEQQFVSGIPRGIQSGLQQTATGAFADVTRNFGTEPQNLSNVRNTAAKQMQAAFLAQEQGVRDAIAERQGRAAQLREQIRQSGSAIDPAQAAFNLGGARAQQAAFIQDQVRQGELQEQQQRRNAAVRQFHADQVEKANERIRRSDVRRVQEQQRLQSQADALFRRQNAGLLEGPTRSRGIERQAAGVMSNLTQETGRLTKASQDKNRALDEQSEAHGRSHRTGLTYLSTLSALHAASFLLTNRTFSAFFSLVTLGAAFTRVGLGASLLGVTLGGVLLGLNAIATGVQQVQALALTAGQAFIGMSAGIAAGVGAAVAASTKLASGVEDAFAEIIAFGRPTQEQIGLIEERVSSLARRFGISGQEISQASSQYIRAGGEIADAIEQDALAAVVKLQVASRQELLPQNAARVITTITNAFKNESVTAAQAANLVIATAQKSALTFTEVSQAFQQAAPQAANLKIPVEELAATIAVLANNGLRGQVAGTGLKQVLLDLLNPSKQARETLERYNISLFDTQGKVRPLGDIFADMNRAFGDQAQAIEASGDAMRGQAIAAIFGSRANLAASIIARTGAKDYEKMRDAINSVDADDVLATLLATTSSQVRIFIANVTELARAFGGPLNTALGAGINLVNEFFQSIGRRSFELAGQAVIAVGSAQGFAPIIRGLEELEQRHPRVAAFFNTLLNSALTVRNAFVTQFVPAVQTAAQTIDRAFTTNNIQGTFTGITTAILSVVNVGSQLAQFIGQLISDFVTGNQRGQELRRTVIGLATSIGTSFVGALAFAAIPMAVAIRLLQAVGTATIDLLDDLAKFNNLWAAGWELAKASVNNFLKDVAPRLQGFGELLVGVATRDLEMIRRGVTAIETDAAATSAKNAARQFGSWEAAISDTEQRLRVIPEWINEIDREIAQLKQQIDVLSVGDIIFGQQTPVAQRIRDLQDQKDAFEREIHDIQQLRASLITESQKPLNLFDVSATVNAFQEQIDSLRKSEFSLDDIINFGEGDLPTFLSELAKRAAEIEEIFNRRPDTDPTTPGFFGGNTNSADDISKKIVDIFTNANRELENLVQDSNDRRAEADQELYERLLEQARNFNQQIVEIDRDVVKRRADILRDIQDSRTDRAFQNTSQRIFERIEQQHDAFVQRRDFREQRALAASELINQRRLQDEETVLSQIQRLDEEAFQRSQQLADRAFQRQQQDQERALSKRQSREEEALTKELDRESKARDERIRLAEAKTPEERTRVNADIRRERENTKFQEGQQQKIKSLRERHEREQLSFSRSQEDQAFTHRIQQQVAEFNFRILLERKYLEIRRGLENIENQRVEQRDAGLLEQRIARAVVEAERRRVLQEGQQRLSDQYEDNVIVPRRFSRIDEEAAARKRELGTRTAEQIFRIIDDAEDARIKALIQRERQSRTIQQRATERVRDLTAEVGFTPTAATQQLDALILRLAIMEAQFVDNQNQARQLFQIIESGALGDINRLAAGADLNRQPFQNINIPAIFTQPQNLQTGINESLRISLPPDFSQMVASAISNGWEQLATRSGISRPNQVVINGGVHDTGDIMELFQRFLYTQRR